MEQINHLILGCDAGNHKNKIAGVYGVDSYKTNICNWFERDVKETFGEDDMEFEIGDRKGFAGSIAEQEDEFGNGTTYGDTKAHEDTKIRVLLGIHRYIKMYCPSVNSVSLVVGQPINNHKEGEKIKIIKMLKGQHDFIVNDTRRTIYIKEVKVSPEGSGGFWSNPRTGLCRVIDCGSGTINMATILDKKHIHKSSDTMNTGMETIRNKGDLESLARAIFQKATKLKWNKNDTVLICGGIADPILPYLTKHFHQAEILQPQLRREYDILSIKPVYANAVGFYNLAKWAFK